MTVSPRVLVSGNRSISDLEVENIHVEFVGMIEELFSMAGTRPATGVFDAQYNGAEKSLWDNLSPPSQYKIEKVDKTNLVKWVEMAGKLLVERLYPVVRSQLNEGKKCSEIEKKYMERQEDLISAQKALVGAQEQLLTAQLRQSLIDVW